MTRRRKWWLLCGFAALVAGIGVTCYLLASRDADFKVASARTKSIRAHFAKLDSTIDAADFHDCKTLRATLDRLHNKFGKPEEGPWRWSRGTLWRFVQVDNDVADYDAPVAFPAESTPMTLKDFLRLTMRQVTDKEVGFIVRRHYIEATSLKRAEEEQARYVESIPIFDRVKNAWKELTGHVEDDPIELITITTWSSYYHEAGWISK
jgi:hypothetical protein